ncbi:DUF86 domain-containing protein [Methylotuvimicrobium sp. KM1]|uniref:type VII toxin-antitoxin system HepT family RNase toxin n=1 Tax=Methylotuvimicrobium sp. KM1 TaxID=3377707 RepID=UPI00384EE17E
MPDYLNSIVAHINECREDLEQLAKIASRRAFTRMERRAAERALQVLIEACIGIAKYWLKSENKHLPLDAYESFNKLAELQKISLSDLMQWRKVIGMRNALVHDYLTIDAFPSPVGMNRRIKRE